MSANSLPMSEMNMTPLVDVLLVLLIMFIITIPPAVDSLTIDLPSDCADCPLPDIRDVKNSVTIDAEDRLLWNGAVVGQSELRHLLARSLAMPVEPELRFEPAGSASYAVAAKTLAVIKASGVTRFGFVGNERYRNFGTAG